MTWLAACAVRCMAVDPWPGEAWNASSNLSFLGASAPHSWASNLSGAYWNPVTRRLWVANNSGSFSVHREDGQGSFTAERHYSPGGDLEGITQADAATNSVYLMVENAEDIREYRVSDGTLLRTWDLTPTIGALGNSGTEGIAFVPDAWLAAGGFRDGNGSLYTNSVHGTNGLGGIMLVAVQGTAAENNGCIYAVDLRKDGTHTFVGKYKTSRGESCDLAFDSSVGRLYVLHNIDGNILEVTGLTSSPYGADRRFTTLREIQVPSGSNIEGFGLTPALTSSNTVGDRWCFFTDDNNSNGALRWFRQLPSRAAISDGNSQSAPVSCAVPARTAVALRDAYGNGLPGVAVAFAVTSGGGSCAGSSAVTAASGVANAGAWTLGPAAGANTLSASAPGFSGSPVSFVATGLAAAASMVLVATNAAWAYMDNGSDQGTAWRGTNFDDTLWPAGPAPLGYGDAWIATTNGYGTNSNSKYITTYYRRSFIVSDPSMFGALRMRLNRDDGAVVYVNGVEVRRDNMPAGGVTYATPASSAVGGSDESAYFETSLAPSVLVAGVNVIAAEVHQNSGASTDLSFALGLVGMIGALRKGPYLVYPGGNTQMKVLWQTYASPAESARLEWGPTAALGYGSGALSESGSGADGHQFSCVITGLIAGAQCFYRVTVDSNAYPGSFFAAPAESDSVATLYGFGDTRTYPDRMERVTAAMLRDMQSDPGGSRSVALHVGDWVEFGGTESGWDNEFFNRSYAASVEFMARAAVMGARGNHDIAGGATLMPKYWPYSGTNGYYSFDYGPAHVAVIDQYAQYTNGTVQYVWLTNDLSMSAKPFKIALMHVPAYSAGGGHANDAVAQQTLCPVFTRYGVQLAVAGHNHYYAHCYTNGVHHLTLGGGGAPLHTPDPGSVALVTAESAYSYARFDFSNGVMTVTAVRTNDTVIEAFTVPGRFTLTVNSALGGEYPGTVTTNWGSELSQWVTNSPVAGGGTQFVCLAGAISGNSGLQFSPTNVILTLTNNAALSWQWGTQYWLSATSSGSGWIEPENGWLDRGSSANLVAHPGAYSHFTFWTGAVHSASNPLPLTMDQACSLTAIFEDNLCTNGTPEWWLAHYGWTNAFNAAETNDADLDGLPTWQEWIAGTDPTNRQSLLHVANSFGSGPWPALAWPSVSNRWYGIDRATNLVAPGFEILATNLPSTPPMNVYTDQVPVTEKLFYRVNVAIPH